MRNLCIVGLQWGDEGKGKIVDYYADRFEAVVRYNGGSNAGHTIVIGGRTFVFHLLPSGSLKKKKLLIGPGVALDPLTLRDELDLIAKEGGQADLLIDSRCTVVTPLEKEMDAFIEGLRGDNPIGTTKRGIGPSYAMRALRLVPRAGDLDNGTFDMSSAVAFYRSFMKTLPDLESWTSASRRILEGRTGDVGGTVMDLNEKGHSVMFEGAQGVLLDLVYGTYPYVTGAHTIATYVPAGLGIPNSALGDVMGVAKAYTTRVGGGPFPTEMFDETGDKIRREGKEYGATTGRPRRIGWLDLVALKYAVRLNGVSELALTKLDILTKVREMKVCTAYSVDGRETSDFSKALPRLASVRPVYKELPSFSGADLKDEQLPRVVEDFVGYLEDELRVKVTLVSTGEERSATIRRSI
ncbi:MAG: adenylosuccinate synthase [Nitrososphaerota archaeon]|nr:adenylosuccinate synthase [Nitrososphaerota archaeon]